jgi:hypothetical protein
MININIMKNTAIRKYGTKNSSIFTCVTMININFNLVLVKMNTETKLLMAI